LEIWTELNRKDGRPRKIWDPDFNLGCERKGEERMLNRANGRQQLNFVNKLIRAISEEMPKQSTIGDDASSVNRLPDEMKEALQQLRLRKLLISAIVESDRSGQSHTRH